MVLHKKRWSLGGLEEPYPAATGNLVLATWLLEYFAGLRGPFLVARLSLGAELSTSVEAELGKNLTQLDALQMNAGVYPRSAARSFLQEYKRSFLNASIAAKFGGTFADAEDFLFRRWCPPGTVFVENRALEPFYFGHKPWSHALRGKRVLVVHPFAKTIQNQYHRQRRLLFPNTSVLPEMAALETVTAYLTLGRTPKPHASWTESLRSLEARIDCSAFDVALLGCGAFGMPLTNFIYSRCHKPAIYIGGALQLLFGIKGNRWKDRPEFHHVFRHNSAWVWPSFPDETPPGAALVEDAAYWGGSVGDR